MQMPERHSMDVWHVPPREAPPTSFGVAPMVLNASRMTELNAPTLE
jgi:anti-sigma-K factor RskA